MNGKLSFLCEISKNGKILIEVYIVLLQLGEYFNLNKLYFCLQKTYLIQFLISMRESLEFGRL